MPILIVGPRSGHFAADPYILHVLLTPNKRFVGGWYALRHHTRPYWTRR